MNDNGEALSSTFTPVVTDNYSVASTVTMKSLASRQLQTERMLQQYGKTMEQNLGLVQSKDKDDKPPPSRTENTGGTHEDPDALL